MNTQMDEWCFSPKHRWLQNKTNYTLTSFPFPLSVTSILSLLVILLPSAMISCNNPVVVNIIHPTVFTLFAFLPLSKVSTSSLILQSTCPRSPCSFHLFLHCPWLSLPPPSLSHLSVRSPAEDAQIKASATAFPLIQCLLPLWSHFLCCFDTLTAHTQPHTYYSLPVNHPS